MTRRMHRRLTDEQIELIAQALQYAACAATLSTYSCHDSKGPALVELADLFGSLDCNASDFLLSYDHVKESKS